MPAARSDEDAGRETGREPLAPVLKCQHFRCVLLTYVPLRVSQSQTFDIRGLALHLRRWETGDGPLLVMLHGWMDVSASFQFVVDRLAAGWQVAAPDWRGFGQSSFSGADSYWFPDYLADLDFLLDRLSPDAPVALVGHSMGGNIAMLYAGIRPHRVSAVVNLEGFGLRSSEPQAAVERYRTWLDDLHRPAVLRDYPDPEAVVDRLMRNNPRLDRERARFLAPHWARPSQGRWQLAADAAHRRANPIRYRLDEVLACWREITAPVLWVASDADTEMHRHTRTPAFRERLSAISCLQELTVTDAGHMLHHDRPEAVARAIEGFIPR